MGLDEEVGEGDHDELDDVEVGEELAVLEEVVGGGLYDDCVEVLDVLDVVDGFGFGFGLGVGAD